MLVPADLASAIRVAIGATDKDGNPITTTPEMLAYANAIIDTLSAGSLDNATGSVTGTGIPLSPLVNGAASGGLLTLSSGPWSAALSSGFPSADPGKLSAETGVSVPFVESNSQIDFPSGTITGTCTATPATPGILAGGAGAGGQLSGLDGDAWATAVVGSQGLSVNALAKAIYNAIVSYLSSNAEGTYASGQVTGTFGIGGGPMMAGTGVGGSVQ